MVDPRAALPPFGGEEAASPFDAARVAVLPVPYEGTVSYGKGAAAGPAAILEASAQVELFDEQTGLEPFRVGIWTDGPLEIPDGPAARVASAVERRLGELLDAGKWVVTLGGEHSISIGAFNAISPKRPHTERSSRSWASEPFSGRGTATYPTTSRSWQSSVNATRTRSPFQQRMFRPSPHHRWFESGRRIVPVCGRSLRRIFPGKVSWWIRMIRRIRLRLYGFMPSRRRSRLTRACTRRTP